MIGIPDPDQIKSRLPCCLLSHAINAIAFEFFSPGVYYSLGLDSAGLDFCCSAFFVVLLQQIDMP